MALKVLYYNPGSFQALDSFGDRGGGHVHPAGEGCHGDAGIGVQLGQ